MIRIKSPSLNFLYTVLCNLCSCLPVGCFGSRVTKLHNSVYNTFLKKLSSLDSEQSKTRQSSQASTNTEWRITLDRVPESAFMYSAFESLLLPTRWVFGSRVTRSTYLAYNTGILVFGTKSVGHERNNRWRKQQSQTKGSPRVTDSGCRHFINKIRNTYTAPLSEEGAKQGYIPGSL